MNTRSLLPLAMILALTGCKKSDPAPEGTASGTSTESPAGGAPAAGALADFEGEIGLLAKSSKERKPIPPITLLVKKGKIRFDVPEGLESGPKMGRQAHVILSAPEKKLFMVVDDQKMVVTMDLDKLGEQMKSWHPPGQPAPERGEPPKVTKTGHMDTVAGYRCEDWDVASAKGEHGKVCVSSESASWFELPTIGLTPEQAWAHDLFDGHHVPLRFVGTDATGTEDSRIEVTKLEKKAIPDSTFEVPAGYRVMDMGEMMKGLMGGMGGMMPPGMMPGAGPNGMPPGMHLPPGMQLPPGVKLPPGVQMPPNMQMPPGMQVPPNVAEMMKQMQERAKAAGAQAPH